MAHEADIELRVNGEDVRVRGDTHASMTSISVRKSRSGARMNRAPTNSATVLKKT